MKNQKGIYRPAFGSSSTQRLSFNRSTAPPRQLNPGQPSSKSSGTLSPTAQPSRCKSRTQDAPPVPSTPAQIVAKIREQNSQKRLEQQRPATSSAVVARYMQSTKCQKSFQDRSDLVSGLSTPSTRTRAKTPLEKRIGVSAPGPLMREIQDRQSASKVSEPQIMRYSIQKQANFLNTIDVPSPTRNSMTIFDEPSHKTKQQRLHVIQSKLGAVMKGYKVRRILSRHNTLGVLKKEYYDLLSFTFGLQHEMRQAKSTVSGKTKQLMVQSVRDLNQKRKMLNKVLDNLMKEKSAQWLRESRIARDISPDRASAYRQICNQTCQLEPGALSIKLNEAGRENGSKSPSGHQQEMSSERERSKVFLRKGARHTYDPVASILKQKAATAESIAYKQELTKSAESPKEVEICITERNKQQVQIFDAPESAFVSQLDSFNKHVQLASSRSPLTQKISNQIATSSAKRETSTLESPAKQKHETKKSKFVSKIPRVTTAVSCAVSHRELVVRTAQELASASKPEDSHRQRHKSTKFNKMRTLSPITNDGTQSCASVVEKENEIKDFMLRKEPSHQVLCNQTNRLGTNANSSRAKTSLELVAKRINKDIDNAISQNESSALSLSRNPQAKTYTQAAPKKSAGEAQKKIANSSTALATINSMQQMLQTLSKQDLSLNKDESLNYQNQFDSLVEKLTHEFKSILLEKE